MKEVFSYESIPPNEVAMKRVYGEKSYIVDDKIYIYSLNFDNFVVNLSSLSSKKSNITEEELYNMILVENYTSKDNYQTSTIKKLLNYKIDDGYVKQYDNRYYVFAKDYDEKTVLEVYDSNTFKELWSREYEHNCIDVQFSNKYIIVQNDKEEIEFLNPNNGDVITRYDMSKYSNGRIEIIPNGDVIVLITKDGDLIIIKEK